MTIGEVVELLIRLRDDVQLDRRTDDAVCAACNILDKLPRFSTVTDIMDRLNEIEENTLGAIKKAT